MNYCLDLQKDCIKIRKTFMSSRIVKSFLRIPKVRILINGAILFQKIFQTKFIQLIMEMGMMLLKKWVKLIHYTRITNRYLHMLTWRNCWTLRETKRMNMEQETLIILKNWIIKMFLNNYRNLIWFKLKPK